MNNIEHGTASLWTRGMIAVLLAQFLSAMADNALLFGALALLRSQHYADWVTPVLQEFFVGAYIILAPFAGPFADALPKGKVMLIANGLKLAGALAMCIGLNPFVAYGVVGIGAAAYSPAKYGILSELVGAEQLVKANGLIESSTIAAILVGVIAGGFLADWSIPGALIVVTGCYGAAAVANLLIPRLPPAHPLDAVSLSSVLKEFGHAVKALVRNPEVRFSMTGTSLFWGTGSTLRLILIAWVPIALGNSTNSLPAELNGMTAIGIVVGAALAGKFITLDKADRALPAGVLIGLSVCLLAGTTSLLLALVVMVIIGACGGFFVVPLNALVQERGHATVGAGHSVAVQNLAEYSSMLVMIGLYSLAVRAGMPITTLVAIFGGLLSMAMAVLWIYRWQVTSFGSAK
ncbi:MAG TPA: lysophospholipid transporter LplT [Steroidobacteraceae bacterium]